MKKIKSSDVGVIASIIGIFASILVIIILSIIVHHQQKIKIRYKYILVTFIVKKIL